MSVKIGQKAPDFAVEALFGDEAREIKLSDFAGQWVVLFFYPKDFSAVCPTELVEFARAHDVFKSRGVVLLGGSTDSVETHRELLGTNPGLKDLPYGLFADTTKSMTTDYGVLFDAAGLAARGTFIIDPDQTVQWINVTPLRIGRSIQETLRMVDALQTEGLMPCDWKKGDELIKV